MSLLAYSPDSSQFNYEPGPIFQDPTVLPADSPDGYSPFAGLTGDIASGANLFVPIDTQQNFYPISPSPGASGSNVVTINGQQYTVTPDNYSALARMYIDWQRTLGNKMYDDKTPAAYGTGQVTTRGNLASIALADAYRQLAGMAPINYSVDPLTGVAIPNNQTASAVFNNPVNQAADAISRAGTSLFTSASSLTKGASQGITDLAGVLQSVGAFFATPGVILIVGAGIVGFILFKKGIIK